MYIIPKQARMASSTDGWVRWSSTSICTYNVEAFPLGHFPTWPGQPLRPHTRDFYVGIDFKVIQFYVRHTHPAWSIGWSIITS